MSGRRASGKVLLVEGNDDRHVFFALLTRHVQRIPRNSFAIEECEGIEPLLENLDVRLKASNDTGPRLGIWLMPARDYVENARTLGAKFSNRKASKARIHAWLAIQEDPGKPLGQAITARYLDAEAEVVLPLLAWLESLFLAS